MPRFAFNLIVAFAFVISLFVQDIVSADSKTQPKAGRKPKRKPNPVLAPIKDDPSLPRVLLIGDSISMGYTLPVRTLLKGKVNLHRIPTNGGPTTRGVENIEQWLGKGKWDMIHFNWGLHDLKYINGKHQVSIAEYEANLKKLVKRLKKTNAKLIWCSTTPVPLNVNPPRKNEDVLKFNQVAAAIMKNEEVEINDLYSFAKERLTKIQRPDNVHFTSEGSQVLGKEVARVIQTCAAKKN